MRRDSNEKSLWPLIRQAALAFPAWSRWRLLMAITTLALVSEFVQIWVPGRTASVGEALLDVMAAALGMLLAGALARLAGWRSPG